MQDQFGSRALADRLEEKLARTAFTDDARLLVERDGGLAGPMDEAARVLLYLFERDWGVQLLRGG